MRSLACLAAIVGLGLVILLPSTLAVADEGGAVAALRYSIGYIRPQPSRDIADCSISSKQGQDSRPIPPAELPSTGLAPTPTQEPTRETPAEPTKPTSTPTAEPTDTRPPLPTDKPTNPPVIAPSGKPTTPAPSPTMTEPQPTELSSPSSEPTSATCYRAGWGPTCAPTSRPTTSPEPPTETLTDEPTLEPTHPRTPTGLPPTSMTPTHTPTSTPLASPTISDPPPSAPASHTTSLALDNAAINNPPALVILPATSLPTAASPSPETDAAIPTPGSFSSFESQPPPLVLDRVDAPKLEHPIVDAVASPLATAIAIVGMATVTGSGLIIIRRVGIPKM